MSKPRTGLYLGLAAAGAGGYYLYRSGGDPQVAKEKAKLDANKLTHSSQGNKAEEFGGKVDEAVDSARSRVKADDRIPDSAQEGFKKIDELRQDAQSKLGSGVDKFDHEVEKKASEAKGAVKGWFGK